MEKEPSFEFVWKGKQNIMPAGRPRKFDRKNFEIIKLLHRERKKRKIPLKLMEHMLSVGMDVVGQWERGEHKPPLDRLVKWCDSLGFELVLKRRDSTLQEDT